MGSIKWDKASIEGYGNLTYYAYIPDNIDSSTQIILYEHGGGGETTDNAALLSKLRSEGSDDIVVFYTRTNADGYSSLSTKLVENVAEEYGVSASNLNTVGFSYGAVEAVTTAGELVTDNPDADAPTVMILDGSYPNKGDNAEALQNASKALGEKNGTIFAVQCAGITANDDLYKSFAENGMNVFLIDDYGRPGHQGCNRNYVNNNLLEFQSGTGTFPNVDNDLLNLPSGSNYTEVGTYTVRYINKETLEFEEVDIGGMTLSEVYEWLGYSTKKSASTALSASLLGMTFNGKPEFDVNAEDVVGAYNSNLNVTDSLDTLQSTLSGIGLTVELSSGYLLDESKTLTKNLVDDHLTLTSKLTQFAKCTAETEPLVAALFANDGKDDILDSDVIAGNNTSTNPKSTISGSYGGSGGGGQEDYSDTSSSADTTTQTVSTSVDNSTNTASSSFPEDTSTDDISTAGTYTGGSTASTISSKTSTSSSSSTDTSNTDESDDDFEIPLANADTNAASVNGYLNPLLGSSGSVTKSGSVAGIVGGATGLGVIGGATYAGNKYIKNKQSGIDDLDAINDDIDEDISRYGRG